MNRLTVAPHGSWKSPITSDLILRGTVRLGQIVLDGEDIYWAELRPSEAGRVVVVRLTPDGKRTDITPPGFNSRTRVHEYGGGAYAVADSAVYFSNFADQRLYRVTENSAPEPLTPPSLDLRYADSVVDRARRRLITVREDHTDAQREAVNTIVALAFESGVDGEGSLDTHRSEASESVEDVPNPVGGRVLVEGNDFYSSPRVSPGGERLAWLTWNHPNMPWDGCELWVGEFDAEGNLGRTKKIAGGVDESIFQPEWSPDGALYFVSDRSGWWNLYRVRLDDGSIESMCEMEAEFGAPQWVFGMATYAFASADEIVCTYCVRGTWRLAKINTATRRLESIETPYTEINSFRASNDNAVFVAGSPTKRAAVVRLDLATNQFTVLRRASEVEFAPEYLSVAEAVEYPTTGGLKAHAFFYPPRNADFQAPEGERPPLLVMCHGGPTAATSNMLRPDVQYWTSRGVAVLDVNYGGSTGYGRAYRERLDRRWGIVDIDDCVNGARYLAERNEVDGERCAITGGSAGGYTTLAALTFRRFFKAGASHFGISDLAALVRDTHKFESRYFDRLVGPYPAHKEVYFERSPINFTEKLSCPVIFFQGLEDKVVPPNQAELMVEALRRKGLPVAYVPFEGEQHGFRRAENIKRALEGELYFYSRVFGFPLADEVEPVAIDNLN